MPSEETEEIEETEEESEIAGLCHLRSEPIVEGSADHNAYTAYRVTDALVCRSCIRSDYLERCSDCTAYSDNLLRTRSEGNLCESCDEAQGGHYYCDACGEYVNEDEYGGDDHCIDCVDPEDHEDHEDGEFIFEYSYRPAPHFHHAPGYIFSRQPKAGTAYLGLELEISIQNAREGARIVTEAAPELIYCKTDSSVAGFELVTHPMTLEAAKEIFPFEELRTLRNEYSASGYNNGIHIHVSRDGFTNDSHVYRWMKLIYRNPAEVVNIARRYSSQWAEFHNGARFTHKHTAEKKKGTRNKLSKYVARYSAINVQNEATFELRIFRGSLRKDEILAALELVAASVEYTRSLSAANVLKGALSWHTFINWAAEQRIYSNLVALNGSGKDEQVKAVAAYRQTSEALLRNEYARYAQTVAAEREEALRRMRELVAERAEHAELQAGGHIEPAIEYLTQITGLRLEDAATSPRVLVNARLHRDAEQWLTTISPEFARKVIDYVADYNGWSRNIKRNWWSQINTIKSHTRAILQDHLFEIRQDTMLLDQVTNEVQSELLLLGYVLGSYSYSAIATAMISNRAQYNATYAAFTWAYPPTPPSHTIADYVQPQPQPQPQPSIAQQLNTMEAF